MNKILIIAPHLDDEVLGCGGIIAKHTVSGDEVYVAFIANRVYAHKYEPTRMKIELEHLKKAKDLLGYKDYVFFDLPDEKLYLYIQEIIINLEKYVDIIKPDIVYSPFIQDNNQDHRAVAEAVRVVLRPSYASFVKKWLMYETPSSTEQSPSIYGSFKPNYYIDIENYLERKLDALDCYETESRNFPHPRSREALKCQAMKRGIEINCNLAEAFMIVREKK